MGFGKVAGTLAAILMLMATPAGNPVRAAEEGGPDSTGRAAQDGQSGLEPGSVAEVIYGFNHLGGLPETERLVYAYRLEGSILENPYEDEIIATFHRRPAEAGAEVQKTAAPQKVQEGAGEPTYDVDMTVFTGTRNQQVPTLSASRANPLLVFFFQHDGMRMSRNTGGSGHYFRNAMRRAINAPGMARPETLTLDLNDRPVEATAVQLRPFAADANRARLMEFANKVYRFVMSPSVPGGIYELEAVVPGPEGLPPLLRETYRLKESTP